MPAEGEGSLRAQPHHHTGGSGLAAVLLCVGDLLGLVGPERSCLCLEVSGLSASEHGLWIYRWKIGQG